VCSSLYFSAMNKLVVNKGDCVPTPVSAQTGVLLGRLCLKHDKPGRPRSLRSGSIMQLSLQSTQVNDLELNVLSP